MSENDTKDERQAGSRARLRGPSARDWPKTGPMWVKWAAVDRVRGLPPGAVIHWMDSNARNRSTTDEQSEAFRRHQTSHPGRPCVVCLAGDFQGHPDLHPSRWHLPEVRSRLTAAFDPHGKATTIQPRPKTGPT